MKETNVGIKATNFKMPTNVLPLYNYIKTNQYMTDTRLVHE